MYMYMYMYNHVYVYVYDVCVYVYANMFYVFSISYVFLKKKQLTSCTDQHA